ncbi:hypothetical protein SD71_10805 [Cohnella kolymensis]|uniref:Uncharacterized protein n=1 Tax=Cohnella kolymensis TaxID=1590652 RepID=A0ABR5A4L4_9BACL|nr:hypothetical protein [Cohnella kolymensis]KIL35872.1 hypothetical protein SD71_10805 [Cohnella kolymensis]
MIHAQLDEHLICTGCSNLKQIESHPLLVYLPDGWNEDLLWRKWDGQWSVEKYAPPEPVPGPDLPAEITQLKATQADILLAMVMNDLM